MRKYHYSYAIYKEGYPVYTASTIAQIARYLGCGTKTLEVKSSDQRALDRKREQNNYKIYRYYNSDDKCYDYSQLYYKTRHYEIYRFWSSNK